MRWIISEQHFSLAVFQVEGLFHDEKRWIDGWIIAREHSHWCRHLNSVVICHQSANCGLMRNCRYLQIMKKVAFITRLNSFSDFMLVDGVFVCPGNSIVGRYKSILNQFHQNFIDEITTVCIVHLYLHPYWLSLKTDISYVNALLLSKLAYILTSPFSKNPQTTGLVMD